MPHAFVFLGCLDPFILTQKIVLNHLYESLENREGKQTGVNAGPYGRHAILRVYTVRTAVLITKQRSAVNL